MAHLVFSGHLSGHVRHSHHDQQIWHGRFPSARTGRHHSRCTDVDGLFDRYLVVDRRICRNHHICRQGHDRDLRLERS